MWTDECVYVLLSKVWWNVLLHRRPGGPPIRQPSYIDQTVAARASYDQIFRPDSRIHSVFLHVVECCKLGNVFIQLESGSDERDGVLTEAIKTKEKGRSSESITKGSMIHFTHEYI